MSKVGEPLNLYFGWCRSGSNDRISPKTTQTIRALVPWLPKVWCSPPSTILPLRGYNSLHPAGIVLIILMVGS